MTPLPLARKHASKIAQSHFFGMERCLCAAVNDFRHAATGEARASPPRRGVSIPCRPPPTRDCRSSSRSRAHRDCRSRSALARSYSSDPCRHRSMRICPNEGRRLRPPPFASPARRMRLCPLACPRAGPHGVCHVAIRPFLVFRGLWRTPLRPERPEPPARGLHHDRQHWGAYAHSLSRFIDAVGRRTGGASGRFWASTLSAYNAQPLAPPGSPASSWASCNFSMSGAACGRRCSWRYTLPAPWP